MKKLTLRKNKEKWQTTRGLEKRSDSFHKHEWLILFLKILSVIGAVLTLVGYGVAMSISSAFNVPHELLFSSPFEILDLSVWAVVALIANFPSKFSIAKQYSEIFLGMLPAIIIFSVFGSVCIFIIKYMPMLNRWRAKLPCWLLKLFKRPSATESAASLHIRLGLYITSFLLIGPVVSMLFFALIMFLIFSFSTIPVIGVLAGNAYINQYVVGPKTCAPIVNRQMRLQTVKSKPTTSEEFSQCVSISTEKKNYGRGRVVFSTSSAIILFDPKTGVARRVPTKDAEVEVVDNI